MSQNIFQLKLERADFAVILDECRKQKKFTNVQLQIGDKLFDGHRVVLSAYSPVLEATISDQWSTTKICPISAEYVDPSIVEELLSFLYTGSIDLTPDNIHPVCVAAHFLQIASLLEPCVQYLCRLISVENVLTLFEFSLNYQLQQLRDSCLRFIVLNNHEVFQSPQTLKFSVKNFKDLITELRDQFWDPRTNLRVNTFKCIVRWTAVNPSERLDELPVLLKSIPLEKLPDNILSGMVSLQSLVEGSDSGLKIVSETLAVLKYEWQTHQNLIVFGEDPKKTGRKDIIRCFDWLTESWRTLPDMLEPRRDFDWIVFNKRNIVVFGGNESNHSYSKRVEMFDWGTQTWKKLADLPDGHWKIKCSLASLNGHLYAANGEHDQYSGKFVEKTMLYCYSFETQQWKPLKSMNFMRQRFQLVGYDNHLYAFGGGTKAAEKYDPLLDQWTVVEQGSNGFNLCPAMSERFQCDNHLYAFGGETDIVEKYDPGSDKWTIMEPSSIHRNPAIVHRGKIYARGQTGDLRMFDSETGDWSSIPSYSENGDLVSMNRKLVILDADKDILEFDFSTRQWKKFFKLDTGLIHSRIIPGKFY